MDLERFLWPSEEWIRTSEARRITTAATRAKIRFITLLSALLLLLVAPMLAFQLSRHRPGNHHQHDGSQHSNHQQRAAQPLPWTYFLSAAKFVELNLFLNDGKALQTEVKRASLNWPNGTVNTLLRVWYSGRTITTKLSPARRTTARRGPRCAKSSSHHHMPLQSKILLKLEPFYERMQPFHGHRIKEEFRRQVPQPKNGATVVTEELEALNRHFAQLSSVILERKNIVNVLIQNWRLKQQNRLDQDQTFMLANLLSRLHGQFEKLRKLWDRKHQQVARPRRSCRLRMAGGRGFSYYFLCS